MYFVGHTAIRVNRDGQLQYLSPGEELPEATSFSRLRQQLLNGEIVCDYKDGEKRAEHMPFARHGSFLRPTTMAARLKEHGVEVPEPFNNDEVALVHDFVIANKETDPKLLPAWLIDQVKEQEQEPEREQLPAPKKGKKRK